MGPAILLAALIGFDNATYRERFPLPRAVIGDGLGVNIHFVEPREKDLAEIRAAGFRWVRVDMKWDQIEKSRGNYDFAAFDRLYTALDRQRLRPVFILAYGNSLYGSGAPTDGAYLDAYARFARAAVQRYRERGAIWEVWNEPNEPQFWGGGGPDPTGYVRLAQRTVQAMRQASPQEWIVGPGASGVPMDFMRRVAVLGPTLDAFTVHPYRTGAPESAIADYNRLRRILPSGSTILCTEWGYGVGKQAKSEASQANLIRRAYLSNLAAGVPLTIVYAWTNSKEEPVPGNRQFGMKRTDNTIKPVYSALKGLTSRYAGYRVVSARAGQFGIRSGSRSVTLTIGN